ncbi:hypothetical protein SGCZBJ_04975 [Caulobacter zeae]|uniref:Uncharacterized protein n=1 Tax=Caulobacter zeae TaxID=2055137 RepID=A0A2N5DNU4_9CAUL|nr:hypothetical protein SGCZBJ_04975 [Caulobacter zeae]
MRRCAEGRLDLGQRPKTPSVAPRQLPQRGSICAAIDPPPLGEVARRAGGGLPRPTAPSSWSAG